MSVTALFRDRSMSGKFVRFAGVLYWHKPMAINDCDRLANPLSYTHDGDFAVINLAGIGI